MGQHPYETGVFMISVLAKYPSRSLRGNPGRRRRTFSQESRGKECLPMVYDGEGGEAPPEAKARHCSSFLHVLLVVCLQDVTGIARSTLAAFSCLAWRFAILSIEE